MDRFDQIVTIPMVSGSCNYLNSDTKRIVRVAKLVRPVQQAGQNQRQLHLQVLFDPSLREEVREVRGQAGCVCGRGGGWRVSLSWVMAESSRWCSLEQIGVARVRVPRWILSKV